MKLFLLLFLILFSNEDLFLFFIVSARMSIVILQTVAVDVLECCHLPVVSIFRAPSCIPSLTLPTEYLSPFHDH